MRRALISFIATASVLLGTTADAKTTSLGGASSGNKVSVGAASARVRSEGGGGGSGPVCEWKEATRSALRGLAGPGVSAGDGPALSAEELRQTASQDVGGVTHYWYFVKCPGEGLELRLVDPTITAADLFGLIIDEATRQIPQPQHDMNPAPEHGSVANLGLWLAVEEQHVDPITAEAGPAWITARPRIVNVEWDLGNGDSVDCGGLGEPYPWTNDPGEGPCGYTYQGATAAGSYTITATTRWEIPYTSSSGSGALDPIETSTTYDYNVGEIQTVGTGR